MKKTEMISYGNGEKSWKLILALALLGIVLASLAIIGLIKFGTVLFFVPFWFWTVDKIIELTGANLWLARGFAALFVLPFFYLIKLIFSWKAEKRRVGWILFSLLTASLCFMMFFLSEDIYFSFKTGQAQKWYIVTPAGEYKFSASPGYNTFWGIEYQQVTPEVIKKYVEQERAGKATKTTGNKEIVPAIPKENIPEKKVEETIPEKVIVPQQATPKEVIPEKTAEKIIPEEKKIAVKPVGDEGKEITSKKPTFKIVPKKIISAESPTASGWDDIEESPKETTTRKKTTGADITVWNGFEEVPASKGPPPAKITPEEESLSLSSEEEKFIVKEAKKIIPSWSEAQEKKLSDFLKLLERSGNLPKHEDLLCTIIKENLNWVSSLSNPAKEAISYLTRMGSAKSIPTLMWAYVNVQQPNERRMIEGVIKTIKKREGIE